MQTLTFTKKKAACPSLFLKAMSNTGNVSSRAPRASVRIELSSSALTHPPLRPDCNASERIRLWKPFSTQDHDNPTTTLGEVDIARVRTVLGEAYALSTRSTYGTGLLIFHLFCDQKGIGEELQAPVNPTVLSCFISSLAGTYGGSAVRNYVYGICAWHIVHSIPWKANDNELDALFKASSRLAPKTSRMKRKEPWTIAYLGKICQALNPDTPKDAAILACLTTAFWGAARLGEVTIPNLNSFDPSLHVKVSDVEFGVRDRNNLEETVIFLPWTKAAKEQGEKIFWAKQGGVVDPQAALENHLRVNNPPKDGHLFAFKHEQTTRPMTRYIFLTRINQIVTNKSLEKLPGHGIRVGATLEYLLRGVPFEVVKAKGRWQSDAFKHYLRNHAQIMAPYMQQNQAAHESVIRYTMPPAR